MKILGIIGSQSQDSYNRKLMEYAKFMMIDGIDLSLISLENLPLFNQDLPILSQPHLLDFNNKIQESDAIIISSPEINSSIPTLLKSLLEWMSYEVHPFSNKPVLLLGASTQEHGCQMAHAHLREILNAKGLDAYVMPGRDFILSNAHEKFDLDGRLIDEQIEDYLEHTILKFIKYAELIKDLDLNDIESKYTLTLKAGGYINLDDPNSDGTSGPTDY